MNNIDNLVSLLVHQSEINKNQTLYTFIDELGSATDLNYQELDESARAIAFALQQSSLQGKRVLLAYPPGFDFIKAYFGCLYAGVIAIPVYPPLNEKLVTKIQNIIEDAKPEALLTTQTISKQLNALKILKLLTKFPPLEKISRKWLGKKLSLVNWDFNKLAYVMTDQVNKSDAKYWQMPVINEQTIAFLQYTSGSTSLPRGVIVTHGNLINNLATIKNKMDLNERSVGVIWLPPYHDMGLIGGILEPLYTNIYTILMSPFTFLRNPYVWLATISKYQGTISGGPNFAYQLCVDKITDQQKKELDLSHWKIAFSGAEHIDHDVLNNFYEKFKDCGFSQEAFYPCYGLAEATLFVTGRDLNLPYKVNYFDRNALQNNNALAALSTDKNVCSIVNCGSPDNDVIIIVNTNTGKICGENEIGEIWISGKNITPGYWSHSETNAAIFQAEITDFPDKTFLRTGDMGFLHEQQLYVTGRIKDIIIINGVNYYPHDFEETIGNSHSLIHKGCCAAVPIYHHGSEKLGIICEINTEDNLKINEILQAIQSSIAVEYNLPIHTIALIKPKTLLKTTSGKIQRNANKELLMNYKLILIKQWQEEST